MILPEPYNTLLFLVAIPLILQLFKVIRDNGGAEPSGTTKQAIALVLTAAFVIISGGLAGIALPQAPACSDLTTCVGGWITFGADAVAFLGSAWLVIMGFYDKVWKALFETVGFATKKALQERAAKRG